MDFPTISNSVSFLYDFIIGPVVKYMLWRPLGKLLFDHSLAFEDLPFLQALSMLGSTMAFTHSKNFYPLTYVYDWKHFSKKRHPVIRLGIIGGTAQSAGMFMMSQTKHQHATLLAVGSRTLKSGIDCARKYCLTSCRVYSPYEDLLADPSVEGIVVFCPISTHENLILKILEAGKHCILIPPMAANTAQLKRIWQHQREHHPNLLCVSAYAALAHPVNREMRDIIRSGAVGSVQKIVVRANWPPHAFNSNSIQFNYEYAGGAWEDLGPHAVTLVRFMLDDTRFFKTKASFEVDSATATLPTFASNVDETMNTTLLYRDVRIEIEVSLTKPMDTSIEITGTEGTVHQTQWYRPEMYNRLVYHRNDGTATVTQFNGAGNECGRGPWEYMLDYLVNGFQTLDTPPLGSCEEELVTMEIIDKVYQKAGLGERCPER